MHSLLTQYIITDYKNQVIFYINNYMKLHHFLWVRFTTEFRIFAKNER